MEVILECPNCKNYSEEGGTIDLEYLIEYIGTRNYKSFENDDDAWEFVNQNRDYVEGQDSGIKCPNCDECCLIITLE